MPIKSSEQQVKEQTIKNFDYQYIDQPFKCRLFGPKLKQMGLKLENEQYIHNKTLLAGDIVLLEEPRVQVGVYTRVPEPGNQTIYASLQAHYILKEMRRVHKISHRMNLFLEESLSLASTPESSLAYVKTREKFNTLTKRY